MHVHNIRLIDGTYDLEIANQLLKKFIAAKIAFIENQIEKADTNDTDEINQLKSRLVDLKAETRSLDLFVEEHDGENVEMEIGCTIVMSIKNIQSS